MRRLSNVIALVLFCAVAANAHPMGNFSINHYSRISIAKDSIQVDYLLDFAEIPTFQMFSSVDLKAEVARRSAEWISLLSLQVDGRQLPLRLIGTQSDQVPSAGGLSTTRVMLRLEAPWDEGQGKLSFTDSNYPDRIGWKDIVVQADASVDLPEGNPYTTDITQGLTNYPSDPLASIPSVQSIAIRIAPGKGNAGRSLTGAMTSFFARSGNSSGAGADRLGAVLRAPTLPMQVVLIGLALAFSLGALHALSPGHGKTIVAAYLVGNRGTAKHALFLGLVVTFTHTIGVFMLGLLTLFASQYIVPEKLYPWMGFASGLMILAIGVGLFRQRLSKVRGQSQSQSHTHDHGDGAHSHMHSHGGATHTHDIPETITLRTLLTLGVSGGIVPCPSALVVLLSAVALHRIQLGLLLIVGFSVGLATVLVGIGLVVLRAQRYLSRFRAAGRFAALMPLASAVIITVIGLGVSLQSITGLTP